MIEHVSVVIIVHNGAKTLHQTLESTKIFKEVIVYDNGSTDATVAIATSFSNVILHQGDFFGFGQTKNIAASFAKNDWILSLDCDETLSPSLLESLEHTPLQPTFTYNIVRHNYYKNQRIYHSGWGREFITRLYNRTQTSFTNTMVHEKIISKNTQVLKGELIHFPYFSLSDFIIKADRYSSLYAANNVGKKKSSPAKAFFNGLYSFVRTYVLKRGFLDGWVGLVIAFSHMVTNFFKYMKLYEANKEAGFQ